MDEIRWIEKKEKEALKPDKCGLQTTFICEKTRFLFSVISEVDYCNAETVGII